MSNNYHLREKYQQTYSDALTKLNEAQATAVNSIEGPVMVIAGPGTGKTQIIAVRIGKILQQTDAYPQNILCLTFTESGSVAMRKRLVEIFGPAGHQVHIYTFHAFCNQVIQENLAVFGDYRQLEAISDLELVDVYREIIDELSNDHPLKRLKGDIYYEAKRLKHLFQLMQKDNLNAEEIHNRIDEYLKLQKEGDMFIAKRKTFSKKEGKTYLKGDFREDKWKEETQRYEPLKAASLLFNIYQQKKHELGRYDFNDMILWVIDAFKSDPELLAHYQEKYLYILVDEYQDTNGAQDQLLQLLIEFWEQPNVFVVGDDDQAIYKFQGANLSNIIDFRNRFNLKPIVLSQNYRSSQGILDAAGALIRENVERIINTQPELVKELKAAGPASAVQSNPEINEFENIVHEQAYIIDLLSDVYASEGSASLKDIAVIYRQHSQVNQMVKVLEQKGIPLNIKRKVDILKHPLITNILNILRYLDAEYKVPDSAEHLLFEILHYHFFHIDPRDAAKISIFHRSDANENELRWRDIMSDKETLQSIRAYSTKDIVHLHNLLSKWTADIANVTLQNLFEKILNEGQILNSVLRNSEKSWLLQVLTTFFNFIKEETSKNLKFHLSDLLILIDKMMETSIPLEINKVVHSEKGVNFITSHSAKGLEFDKVFMIGCTKNIWEKSSGGRNSYRFPGNMNADSQTNIEDERRLFYVAMTRAKTQLVISYALHKEDGKDLGPSVFVDEILASTELKVKHQSVDAEKIDDYNYRTLLLQDKNVSLIDHDLIDRVLQNYVLSVTGLNKYLRCPMSFYFETILSVPIARKANMGFGRAVHEVLQDYYEHFKQDRKLSSEEFIALFTQGMKKYQSHFTPKEYVDRQAYGEKVLRAYYVRYLENEEKVSDYKTEHKVTKAHSKGVPIKGIIDKVEILKDHVRVVDYKTGNFIYARDKLKRPDQDQQGGDYWRQIVFYKILIDNDKSIGWNMESGTVDFIEPDKTMAFKQQRYIVSDPEVEYVEKQIGDTWEKIQNHEFDVLCEDELCSWCNFVRNDYVFGSELVLDAEDEIQEA